MNRPASFSASVVALAIVFGCAGAALAQPAPLQTFTLERLHPAPGEERLFAVDTAEAMPRLQVSVHAVTNYAPILLSVSLTDGRAGYMDRDRIAVDAAVAIAFVAGRRIP